MNVLAADIGGTNARFALMRVRDDGRLELRGAPTTCRSAELDGAPEPGVRLVVRDAAALIGAVAGCRRAR